MSSIIEKLGKKYFEDDIIFVEVSKKASRNTLIYSVTSAILLSGVTTYAIFNWTYDEDEIAELVTNGEWDSKTVRDTITNNPDLLDYIPEDFSHLSTLSKAFPALKIGGGTCLENLVVYGGDDALYSDKDDVLHSSSILFDYSGTGFTFHPEEGVLYSHKVSEDEPVFFKEGITFAYQDNGNVYYLEDTTLFQINDSFEPLITDIFESNLRPFIIQGTGETILAGPGEHKFLCDDPYEYRPQIESLLQMLDQEVNTHYSEFVFNPITRELYAQVKDTVFVANEARENAIKIDSWRNKLYFTEDKVIDATDYESVSSYLFDVDGDGDKDVVVAFEDSVKWGNTTSYYIPIVDGIQEGFFMTTAPISFFSTLLDHRWLMPERLKSNIRSEIALSQESAEGDYE